MTFPDTQRQKVYTAEGRLVLPYPQVNVPIRSIDEIRDLAAEVATGLADRGYANVREMLRIELNPRLTTTGGWANPSGLINVHRRCPSSTVIHEVAHVVAYVTHRNTVIPGHGIEFARILVDGYDVIFGGDVSSKLRDLLVSRKARLDYDDASMRAKIRWAGRHETRRDGLMYVTTVLKPMDTGEMLRIDGDARLSGDANLLVFPHKTINTNTSAASDLFVQLDHVAYFRNHSR